jgi:hypothetical protein
MGQTFVIELCQTDGSALTLPVPEPTTRGEARVINTEKKSPRPQRQGLFRALQAGSRRADYHF